MTEVWKNILNYENKYQVSNLGNVRSLNYNNTGKIQLLRPKINKHGYREIKLSKNNKTKNFLVSTLVATTFILNNNPDKVVTHINNRLDDSVENLKWVFKEQIKFLMYKNGNRKGIPTENKISYKGKKYKSISSIARDYKLKEHEVHKRLERGWTLKEALEIPIDKRNCGNHAKFYLYYGKYKTIKQIASENNITAQLLRKRLNRGWNIYEASEIMKGERKWNQSRIVKN